MYDQICFNFSAGLKKLLLLEIQTESSAACKHDLENGSLVFHYLTTGVNKRDDFRWRQSRGNSLNQYLYLLVIGCNILFIFSLFFLRFKFVSQVRGELNWVKFQILMEVLFISLAMNYLHT